MRILAVKTHAFGDALMTTPAVSALVGQGHAVSVLSGPSSHPVWERLPGLERVIPSPLPCGITKLIAWSLVNMQKGFERVIHFGSSSGVRRWLRLLTGTPVEGGSDPGTGFGKVVPAAADYCRMAGVTSSDLRPLFPLRKSEVLFAEGFSSGGKYAVIAPGGGSNPRETVVEKRWSVRGWMDVSKELSGRGFRVIIVGGREDVPLLSGIPGECVAGSLSWGRTAAVIAGASLFCGTDSGPAHLAVAAGIPALVVFGPTDPKALYPSGTITAVTPVVQCAPCYSNSVFPGCAKDSACIRSIGTERVIRALEEMMGT